MNGQPTETIYSLASYRTVLQRLNADELQPDYVDYIRHKYDGFQITDTAEPTKPPLRRLNPALSRCR